MFEFIELKRQKEKQVTEKNENMSFLFTLETFSIQIMSSKKLGLMYLYPKKNSIVFSLNI